MPTVNRNSPSATDHPRKETCHGHTPHALFPHSGGRSGRTIQATRRRLRPVDGSFRLLRADPAIHGVELHRVQQQRIVRGKLDSKRCRIQRERRSRATTRVSAGTGCSQFRPQGVPVFQCGGVGPIGHSRQLEVVSAGGTGDVCLSATEERHCQSPQGPQAPNVDEA